MNAHCHTKLHYAILWIFFFVATQALAQPRGGKPAQSRQSSSAAAVLSGKVLDASTQQPVEYANIVLYSQKDSSLVSGTITDATGKFKLANLKFGNYYLTADFIGYYKTTKANIKLTPRNKTVNTGTITLKRASKQLDEVMVVADRAQVDYKIDRKVINVSQQLQAAGGTAVDALENMPSIQVDLEGNISMRGSSNFTVLIDGKPSMLEGSDALRQIPSGAVESIELITNPSAKYEPDGTAGIINVILKKKKLQGVSGILNAGIGSAMSHNIDGSLNIRHKAWNYTLGAGYSDRRIPRTADRLRESYKELTPGLIDTTFLAQQAEGVRAFGGYNFRLGAEYSLNQHHTVGVGAKMNQFRFNLDKDHDYKEYYSYQSGAHYNQAENDLHVSGLNTQLELSEAFRKDRHSFDFLATYQLRTYEIENNTATYITTSDYSPSTDIEQRSDRLTKRPGNNLRIKADYVLKRNENSSLQAGYQMRLENNESDYVQTDYNPTSELMEENTALSNVFTYRRAIHAVYATYSDALAGFQYKIGLRGEYTKRDIAQKTSDEAYVYEKLNFYPSVYLTRKLSEKHQMQFNYSRRINRPRGHYLNPFTMHSDAFSEFAGNPLLRPSLAGSFELNYLFRFGESFLSAETYYRQVTDQMTRYYVQNPDEDSDLVRATYLNLDDERSMGGELFLNLVLTKWYTLNPVANLYHFEIETNTSGTTETLSSVNYGFRLNNSFKLGKSTRFQLNGNYRSGTVALQGEREPVFSLDLSFRQDLLNRKLSLSANARNLLRTARRKGYDIGAGFREEYDQMNLSPYFTLSISYKLNNYNIKRERPDEDEGGMQM